jgi:hypothetical protein
MTFTDRLTVRDERIKKLEKELLAVSEQLQDVTRWNNEKAAKVEAANKQVKEIKLEAILASMMAIYEGSSEWNKGYKAGAADMIIKIQKELLPVLEVPRNREQGPEMPDTNISKAQVPAGILGAAAGGSLDNPVPPQNDAAERIRRLIEEGKEEAKTP